MFNLKDIILPSILALSITSCSEQKSDSKSQREEQTPPVIAEQNHSEIPSLDTPLSFNEHVQPVLSANCYHCHGPDSGTRLPESEPLRLDTPEGAFAIRENGKPAIIKGNPDSSYLMTLMESTDPDLVMPPHPTKNPHGRIMDPADIALIRRWIKEGANYEKHWAYISPKKAELPEVENKSWVRNPIDNFVLSKLEKNNLAPNPDENKARLLRRLSFDLTGLPPTVEELKAFLADTRDFDTVYAEKIENLLKTDAYAEHFARHWLDVARYSDTHGIHIDNYRSIWPYRDWVINAFRDNMPFDQFTREQIAGDMLPNATLEQKVATGFHRCLPTTGEGGAIPEEYEAIYAQDRVDTTSAAWLGLTAGCAACHDHKFDAISTKENYQLTAFFRNTTMSALDKNAAHHPPNLLIPIMKDRKRMEKAPTELAVLEEQKKKLIATLTPALTEWIKQLKNTPLSSTSVKEAVAHLPLDNKNLGLNHPSFTSKKPLKWTPAPQGDAVLFTNANSINLKNTGDFDSNESFSFGAWINVPKNTRHAGIISKVSSKNSFRGYDLIFRKGNLIVNLNHHHQKNRISVITQARIKNNDWQHIMVTYDGSKKAKGVKIYINGKSQPLKTIADMLTKTIKSDAPLLLGSRDFKQPFNKGALQHFQLYDRALSYTEVTRLTQEYQHNQLIRAAKKGKLNAMNMKLASLYYFNYVNKKTSALELKLAALQRELHDIRSRATYTLIMDVKKNSKPTAHVLIRGQYADKDKEVLSPNVPAALPPMTEDMPKNRLGLAMWLTDKKNPLPARVTANRYWSYLFGSGIVESNKDFGVMGARPTHPKLLDYLAADFMENNWDLHHLLKTIVSSSTYRQNSVLSAEKKERDPLNKLLSRGPRYRLDAEQIRDLALSSSNLLHKEIGGPSVKPYQPNNIWESVAMPKSNTRFYQQDKGKSLYRRSLYTFWKRSAIHPTMEILNAPSRDESCVQRERTNTPLQAFVIMNDPQLVESSRQLATHAIQSGTTQEERINFISNSLISRDMMTDEIKIIKTTLTDITQKFKDKPEEAKKLISVGETKASKDIDPVELASWTIIVNQVLNMDETLNK